MRWRCGSAHFAGLLEGFLGEHVNSGGIWPNQCPVNVPSSLIPLCKAYPISDHNQSTSQTRPSQADGFVPVITVVSVAKVPTSIPGPAHPPCCRFPLVPVKTFGFSLLADWACFPRWKGSMFLSWDKRSSYLLPVILPGSREVSSLLTVLRDNGWLVITPHNTFAKNL